MNCDLLEAFLAKRQSEPVNEGLGRLTRGVIVGEWRVEAYIGSGLSAEVYRVVNIRMKCEGALKLLVNETCGLKERFIDEADSMRYLALPSLPRFLGSGEYAGAPFYVMEYLHPVDDRMSNESFSRLMIKIAQAVQSLHDAGYIHRDLKPGTEKPLSPAMRRHRRRLDFVCFAGGGARKITTRPSDGICVRRKTEISVR